MFAGRRPRVAGFDRYLAANEKVRYSCRRHPIVLLKVILLWLVALIAGSFAGLVESPSDEDGLIDQVAGFIVLALTLYSAWKIAHWWWGRYVITDLRALFIEGIISRKVSSIPLEKVTDTTYARSVWGRLLGYGDLLLDTPGERPGLDTLLYLPNPDEVYRLIASLVVARVWEKPPEPAPYPRRSLDEEDTGPIPRVI
jgi:hypothetical protein